MFNTSFFQQAIALAKKGSGFTSPNPLVGAVVVKQGKVIGTGYHKHAGKDHAEVVAIRHAQKKTRTQGAELYLTLEPCCHVGKTPPCTDTIIAAGIKRVYVGMLDPFHKVNGKSVALLRQQGVQVHVLDDTDHVAQRIFMLNQPFIKWAKTGLPYVTLKAAVSLDGKIATRTKDSHWISNEKQREDARRERSIADAVFVGSGTVQADNPTLAPVGEYTNKKFIRVILDPNLSVSPDAHVFRDGNVIVVTTPKASQKRLQKFAQKNIQVKKFATHPVSVLALLKFLGRQSIQHIFVEGGGGVHGSFFDAVVHQPRVIDRVIWYIAPLCIGGQKSTSSVGGTGVSTIKDAVRLQHVEYTQIDNGMKVSGYLNIYGL